MDENQNSPLNEAGGIPEQPAYPSQRFGGDYSGSYNSAYSENNAAPSNGSEPGKVCGIISLVCGILGIVLCCGYGIAILLSIAAIVLAAVSKKQKGSFSGLAVAGLVCGIVGTVFNLILILLAVFSIAAISTMPEIAEYLNTAAT